MSEQAKYIDQVAPNPVQVWGDPETDVPKNAETLLRRLAAEGCGDAAIGPDMAGDSTTEGMLRHIVNAVRVQAQFDRALLLKTLRELDPVKADEMAAWIIGAAEAGDSYGEWLWQWCDEMGMDADRLCDERREGYRVATREQRPFRVELYETSRVDAGPDGAIRVSRFWWRARHRSNGEVVAQGEGYNDRGDRDHIVGVLFPGVETVEVER